VVLLWAELADQVLFLNVDVFKREHDSPSPWTNFLEIQSPPFFRNRPESVVVALNWIHDTCRLDLNVTDSSQSLPETVILPFDSVETLVPLAGVLLEYPVAFVPPDWTKAAAYFSGETMDFFDVTLRSPAFDSPSALYVVFQTINRTLKPPKPVILATVGPSSCSHAQRPHTRAHLLKN
jgi:hypothetical protein